MRSKRYSASGIKHLLSFKSLLKNACILPLNFIPSDKKLPNEDKRNHPMEAVGNLLRYGLPLLFSLCKICSTIVSHFP